MDNHLLETGALIEQLLNQLFRFGGRVKRLLCVCVCRLCVVYTPHYLYSKYTKTRGSREKYMEIGMARLSRDPKRLMLTPRTKKKTH